MMFSLQTLRRSIASFVLAALSSHALITSAAVLPPRFSVRGGAFTNDVTLALSAAGGGAIRFTLDGSVPDADSPLYQTPLRLTNSCIVRACAFAANEPSAVVAETYTLLEAELAAFTSNLPLVIVNAYGTNILPDRKTLAGLQIIEPGAGRAALVAATDFSGVCWINMRGQSSLRYLKHSYTVKLADATGDPLDTPVLGMPADSDWVLYAPFPDKTLMRDVLAYEMSRKMGHWAPRGQFVEVFVNEAGTRLRARDYVGVYVFEEKIRRGDHRVDIANLKPGDNEEPRVTGGYIFKKDHGGTANMPAGGADLFGFPQFSPSSGGRIGYPTGPGGFPADSRGFLPPERSGRVSSSSSSSSSSRSSTRSMTIVTNYIGRPPRNELASINRARVMQEEDEYEEERANEKLAKWKSSRTNEFWFVHPEIDEITPVQKAWLKRHINDAEAAIYGPDFRDPARGYAAFIDADSFIDYHLLSEATKNVDAFRFSVFFHKDRGGKIKAQPVWDWNLSFGNNRGKQGYMPEYWLWPQLDDKEYSWYRRLFEDPDFGQRYVDRWAQLRTNVFANATVLARVDEIAALLGEAQKRNYEKWPILGRAVNPSYYVGQTYAEEVEWMKKYISTRLDWIERQFPPVPRLVQAATSGKAELAAAVGEIHYTLDGTDPRASGGASVPSAKLYESAILLKPGAKLFARVRNGNQWGGPLVVESGR